MSSSDESEAPLGSEVSGTVDTLVTTVERVVSEGKTGVGSLQWFGN